MTKNFYLTMKKVPHYWKWEAWTQPVFTADNMGSVGVASASSYYSTYTPKGALDGVKSGTDQNKTWVTNNATTGWWKLVLPYKIKITAINFYNGYYGTQAKNIAGRFYADVAMTTPIGDAISTPVDSWYLTQIANISAEGVYTDTLYFNKTGGNAYAGIGELEITGYTLEETGTAQAYDVITYTYEPYLHVVQPPYVPVAETVVTLSTPGSGTYTIPANVTRIKIKITGAGGGGSGWGGSAFYEHTFNGSDGGRGALAEAYLDVIPGQQIPYVIGAGGIKSANVFTDESYYFAVAKAANGSTSSFNTSITAQGGEGAYGPYWANGGDNADYGGIGAPGASYGLGGYGGEGGTYNTISATNGANGSIEITYGGELQRPREEVYAFGTKSKDYYKWVAWTQPVLTSDNDSSGVLVSASSMGTGENPYKVMDGVKSGTLTGASSNYWGALTGDAWWKVKLPYKIKITGLTHYNRYEGTQATYRGVIGRFYADQALTIPIGDQIDTPDTNWYATSIANIPAEGIVTDTIIFKKNDTVLYSGIGELVITAMKAELSTESDYDFYEY